MFYKQNASNKDLIELITKKDPNKKKSRWPAKLDSMQSFTGLLLVLFVMIHLVMELAIVFGDDAMYAVTKFFELNFIIEGGSTIPVTFLGIVILAIIMIHAALGIRKMPSSYRKYKAISTLNKTINHMDSKLWIVQVLTGFILLFVASVHVYMMLSNPSAIGPYASVDRFFTENMWIFYIILLVAVVFHAFIGLYRLFIKWGLLSLGKELLAPRTFDKKTSVENRNILIKIRKYLIIFYLTIGFISIGTYMYKGFKHKDNAGERYTPYSLIFTNDGGE